MTSMSLAARFKRNKFTLLQYIVIETIINGIWFTFSIYAWNVAPGISWSDLFAAWLATNMVTGILLFFLVELGIKGAKL